MRASVRGENPASDSGLVLAGRLVSTNRRGRGRQSDSHEVLVRKLSSNTHYWSSILGMKIPN